MGRPYLKFSSSSYFIPRIIQLISMTLDIGVLVTNVSIKSPLFVGSPLGYNPYFTQAQTDVRHIFVFEVMAPYSLLGHTNVE
jgi:hypothetical protein